MAIAPPMKPTMMVAIIAKSPAGMSSLNAPFVAMSMHFAYSGVACPSFSPSIVLNCLWISATILCAFLSTPRMSIAEKTAGMAAPTRTPKNTVGSMMSNPVISSLPAACRTSFVSAMNAPSREMTVSPAAPIENPFVTALTVFPALSSSSAILIVSSPSPPISARPLALSTTGPYASFEMIMPTIESIPTAAIAMPNIAYPSPRGSQSLYEISAEIAIPAIAGNADMNPYEVPERIVNAGPDADAWATFLTIGFVSSVK